MNYEKINDAYDKNMRSVRIDDTYRAIVMRDDNVFLLLWVDHHDEAYDWARRKRCVLNHTRAAFRSMNPQRLRTIPLQIRKQFRFLQM